MPPQVACCLTGTTLLKLTCCGLSHAQSDKQTDIRKLSQYFIAEQNHAPWRFVPESNIRELSLSEHRGLVTIHEAGTGKDIKGLLQSPLRLAEYPALIVCVHSVRHDAGEKDGRGEIP